MAKKISGWKTKGMNRDLSVSAFNPEFAFENMNLRLSTNEGNTTFSWVNEKGTASIGTWKISGEAETAFTINGTCIGTAVLNEYLVLFITDDNVNNNKDHIYRLVYNGDKTKLYVTELYSGNLSFDAAHPLETLVSYESNAIQKVYWTDGINQPRLINIAPDNDGKISQYTNTSFDFITTLKLNETIKVQKILGGGGMFAPGVIQYAFTYYNKYGQESNIFYTTPLYYISYQDRGGSPEDKIDNTFKISIENVDINFDYLRIYSIQRTSLNATPFCKRVQDINIHSMDYKVIGSGVKSYYATYTDTGMSGDSIDPTELLYKGGNVINVGTIEQKDNTLFMGDIITPENGVPDITPEEGASGISLATGTRSFFPVMVSGDNYEYANQLTSFEANGDTKTDKTVPCAGFKYGDYYRCGVQFQDETGKWTDPVRIDELPITSPSGSDSRPNATRTITDVDDDLPIHINFRNSSTYPITITNTVIFAIKDAGGDKVELEVSVGDFVYKEIEERGGETGAISAKVKHGAAYDGGTFCSASEYKELGMKGNNLLIDTNGDKNSYTTTDIQAGTSLKRDGRYTVECNSSSEPTSDQVYIDLTIVNSTSVDVEATGEIALNFANGVKIWANLEDASSSTNNWTFYPKSTQTYTVRCVGTSGVKPTAYVGQRFRSSPYVYSYDEESGQESSELIRATIAGENGVFKNRGSYTITILYYERAEEPSEEDTINLTIKNNSGSAIELDNNFRFVLVNGDSYYRTESEFTSSSTYTLANGASKTFSDIALDSSVYFGKKFMDMSDLSSIATQRYLEGHSDHPINTYLYYSDGTAIGDTEDDLTTSNISTSTTLKKGGSYTITIRPASEPEPGPSVGNAIVNVQLVNDSQNTTIKVEEFCFILGNGDAYNRTEHASFGGIITLGPGQSQNFTNIEIPGDSLQYVGQNFATQEQLVPWGRRHNVMLYDPEGVAETYDPNDIDPSTVFQDGGSYTIIYGSDGSYRAASNRNARSLKADLSEDSSEGTTEEPEEMLEKRAISATTVTDITITVPVIKGTIPSAIVQRLVREGYKKVRAVVVYPEMQDRVTLCQGVGCPTVATYNHRNRYSADSLGDLYAQSSWFFRAYGNNATKYNLDINAPYYLNNEKLGYVSNSLTEYPRYIRKAEIQGHFGPNDQFYVDWNTLTFHSPDLEFDTSLSNVDYSSGVFDTAWVGNSQFMRTFSDIDIQTETPTISSRGAGFVKKSFIGDGTNGIISGLFWDDYEADDNKRDDTPVIEAYSKWTSSVKWMVYLWNKNGALNNDIERPADMGIMSARLKRKIVSNLRFSYTEWKSKNVYTYYPHLFNSDQTEILKLKINNSNFSNIYMGNIDTLLSPDDSDGMYFAIHSGGSGSTGFKSNYIRKTFAKQKTDGSVEDWGNYEFKDNSWSNFDSNLGNNYSDLVLKKEGVRMKYKSTPHLVLVNSTTSAISLDGNNYPVLPILELQRKNINPTTLFGGPSDDALQANVWIPCGEPVRLDDTDSSGNVHFEYSWGDTYYQRWDCLKTYAFTPEDVNQVVEIGSFMLETRVNIDGRYDRNRGQLSNLYMSPRNFNLINPVYSQLNNFFTYRIQSKDAYKEKKYPNQITWSKTKTSGADVDLWTNVTLASVLEMDGDKGKIRKLVRLNDQLICFQDKGISQVMYNENVQINSTDGVPIEIANSGKVQGKRYFTDSVGCSNKWSMAQTPSGIYFMDSLNKAIFLFNGQLSNLSGTYGFNTWSKKNIPSAEVEWTPLHYVPDAETPQKLVGAGFDSFVAYYDKLNQDVLFINNETALAFSERMGVFTSFYDYGESPYLDNLYDTGVWIRNDLEKQGDRAVSYKPKISLWKHQAGEYCEFFTQHKPYWMTLVGNPEPQTDKIFTNLEFRACVDGDGMEETEVIVDFDTHEETTVKTGKFIPDLPFTSLETWDEYQHGITTLNNRNGHDAFKHHTADSQSSLKRKFRIWRCDIPRDNYLVDPDTGNEIDPEKGITRYGKHPNDRMRNPWLYLKLMKKAQATMARAEIHDIVMTYFN